jgi:hypothetical protein
VFPGYSTNLTRIYRARLVQIRVGESCHGAKHLLLGDCGKPRSENLDGSSAAREREGDRERQRERQRLGERNRYRQAAQYASRRTRTRRIVGAPAMCGSTASITSKQMFSPSRSLSSHRTSAEQPFASCCSPANLVLVRRHDHTCLDDRSGRPADAGPCATWGRFRS